MSSSSIGPISGINYGNLVNGLTAVDQAEITSIGGRINTLQQQDTALQGLNALVTGLKVSSASFISSSIFRSTVATSANTNILNATGGIGTPVGNYAFTVQRLASASQQVTQGFSDTSTALGISGTINLQTGGKQLGDASALTQLNGGNGVARGTIRVTDGSGATTLIDLSDAVDINDVVSDINSATGVSVSAKVNGDHLVLTDNSGGTGGLKVVNTGGTTTATDLGLTGTSSGGVLTGTSLTKITSTTSLDTLNDGNGVRTTSASGGDFSITGADNNAFNVSLGSAKTVGDVISAINTAGQSHGISAAVSADGSGITLTDSGGGPINVAAQNNSLAAYDLGIVGTSAGGTLTGDRVSDELSGPLLRDLNGGNQGTGGTLPQYGTVTVNGQSIDLTNARSLQDVIEGINTNTQGVTAAIDSSGTGIMLTSSAGSFTVADGTGNLASYLHIAGTSAATATGSQIASGDLNERYISNNTLLSTLNAGQGIAGGKIQITDGTGTTATVDLTGKNITSIGDVIKAINAAGVKVQASINNTGDGILLTQTGGTGTASVSDVAGGKMASQLHLSGNFSSGTLNGSLQQSINVTSTDTLSTIATKINNLTGVAASIINDGSSSDPFRLSISSRNSGSAGRVTFNFANSGTGSGLTTTTLVQGQDAVLVYGGNANGTGGLLTTNASNTITGLVPSMTLNLTGTGTTTVGVTNDTSKITTAVQTFVDSYNQVVNNITTATAFNSTDQTQNGVLFGNSTVQQVQDALGQFVNQSYSGYGQITGLSSLGITVNQDGTLALNTDTLNSIVASDPTDIQNIFTKNTQAVTGGPQTIATSTLLSTLNSGSGVPSGHISITDGFGTAHDIDLTAASSIGDVISAINSGAAGTVTATLNGTGDGILLKQVGGTGVAQVSEVNGGATAAALNIKGLFNSSGQLNGEFPPILPSPAVKGIGAVLSDLVTRFTDAQTGILFDSSTALESQQTQLTQQQTSLTTLLNDKKNVLMMQFANLETTIANLQSQGSALSSLTTTTASTSSSTKTTTG